MVPYIAIYMKMIGLSPSETALTFGVVSLVTAFSRTFVGGVADKLNAHKTVSVVMCLLSATFHGSMLLVPQRAPPETNHLTEDVQLHCGTNGAYVVTCSGRPADNQHLEIAVNISGRTEIESYADDVGEYLSFNATECRWTCKIRQHENTTRQTRQVCFARIRYKKYITLHDATTLAFVVTKLQRKPADECRATYSRNSNELSCHCYKMLSFVVRHDSFDEMVCQNQTALICSTDCVGLLGGSVVRETSPERTGYHFGWTFWGIAIPFLLGQATIHPLFGLTDAMAYTVLAENLGRWGKQRLWGTMGFAVFGLTSGILMDVYGHGKNAYTIAFLLFAIFMVLASVSACQYNLRGLNLTRPSRVFHDVLGVARRPDAFVLFCVVLIFGMYQGLIYTFLFWYLKLLGDVPQVLFGLCLVHSCVPETVMLFFSGAIIHKIGHVFSMSIVFVAFAIRMAGYSFLSNPWMVLCIEPLHAFTFGLMYSAASTYASRITPPGTHGSVQSVIGSLFFSFGE